MSDQLARRRLILTAAALFPSLSAGAAAAQTRRAKPGPAATPDGPLPDDRVLGDPKARVQVIEYASVGCPICAEWGKTVFPTFKAKYIATGKVRFVYREMIVGGGVEVTAAAAGFILARCAPKERYFDVIEALYRDQEAVFKSPRPALLAIAKSAGLSEAQFNACLADDAAYTALYKRTDENARVGKVYATPTFVIDGKPMAPGYQDLKALDAAIAKA